MTYRPPLYSGASGVHPSQCIRTTACHLQPKMVTLVPKISHIALMTSTDVVIQLVAACECLGAVLAIIKKCSIEVDVLNMLPHVATVRANFATHSAFVAFGTFLHNVLIQLPSVPACKQQ